MNVHEIIITSLYTHANNVENTVDLPSTCNYISKCKLRWRVKIDTTHNSIFGDGFFGYLIWGMMPKMSKHNKSQTYEIGFRKGQLTMLILIKNMPGRTKVEADD